MKRRLLKSLRLTFITVAVALISIGQPFSFGFLKLSTNEVLLYASEKESKDNTEIANIAKKITVQIIGAGDSGSGVLVKKEGNRFTVLTAWHVIKDNLPHEEVEISTFDGENYLWEGNSRQRLGELDMAIMTFQSKKNYQVATIGDVNSLNTGETVFVSGFPLPTSSVQISVWRFIKGDVIANAKVPILDGYQLLYSNPTLPGMSGGSVLNSKGELVGIHGRAEINMQASIDQRKLVASGTNQAIPITYYQQLAKGERILMRKIKVKSSDDYLAQAIEILNVKGKEKDAIQLVNKALEEEKTSIAYLYRAISKHNLEDYYGAIEDYSRAIEINPNSEMTYYNRAKSKYDLRDYKGAFEDFTRAIEIKPNFGFAYNNRGISTNDLKDYKSAIEDYTRAIEINPNFALSYNNRGVSKTNLKDYKGAIEDFTRAIEIDPKYVMPIYNRAFTKFKQENYIGAVLDNTRAIEIDPNLSRAYNNRAMAKFKLGNKKGACNDFKMAVSLKLDRTSKWFNSQEGEWCRNMPD